MAQNDTNKKPGGLCKKIQNTVSPFGARFFRMSHQPPGSISKPLSQTTQQIPVRISSPQTKPVRILHQPSHSKMIPVEFEPRAPHFPGQDLAEGDVAIVKSRKFSKTVPKKEKNSEMVQDDENKFSDYISKVKDRMVKTASHVSGGVETSPTKDSFNEKVTNYINRAKIKVRKTTSVGDNKSFSLK